MVPASPFVSAQVGPRTSEHQRAAPVGHLHALHADSVMGPLRRRYWAQERRRTAPWDCGGELEAVVAVGAETQRSNAWRRTVAERVYEAPCYHTVATRPAARILG